MMSFTPCFSAALTTASSRYRPLAPVLITGCWPGMKLWNQTAEVVWLTSLKPGWLALFWVC
jgi:hypothetical protein